YKSIVVLANPKTILKNNCAKKEIKEQVIRADQLIRYIKEECEKSKNEKLSDKSMLKCATNIMNLHKERKQTDCNKYKQYLKDSTNCTNTVNDSDIYNALKSFRLKKSREENIKPYYIFNNKELDELVEKKPTSKEELINISGFGKVKIEKYGDEIISIIRQMME
ncbi:MAG: HRDC domain-containing protein, partial [Lachnospiraceae bacterium]|nr:HRDC domain-containing protein [Lachnospiraceae bacterium]